MTTLPSDSLAPSMRGLWGLVALMVAACSSPPGTSRANDGFLDDSDARVDDVSADVPHDTPSDTSDVALDEEDSLDGPPGDVRSDVEAGSGWWSDYPPQCGPTERRIVPEAYRPPEPPQELGQTPRVLWQTQTLCPDTRTSIGLKNSLAYGEIELEGGERRRLLVAVHLDVSGSSAEGVPAAIALIEPRTGELLGCQWIDSFDTSAWDPPVIISNLGRYYYLYNTNYGRGSTEVMTGPTRLDGFFLSPNTNGDDHFGSSGSVSPLAVTPTGLLLATAGGPRTLAFNLFTGQMWWTLGRETAWPGVDHTNLEFARVWVDLEERIHLSQIDQNTRWTGQVYTLDNCAVPTLEYQGKGVGSPRIELGDGRVFYTRWDSQSVAGTAIDRDWVTEHFEPGCFAPVATEALDVACLRGTAKRDGEIVVIRANGERVVHILPHIPDEEGGQYRGWLLAVTGNKLITGINLTVGLNYGYRIFVVSDGGAVSSFDLAPPAHRSTVEVTEPPILTPDGLLILGLYGNLTAVQTDIFGLAHSPFPRSHLGGNENRGRLLFP